MTTEHQPLSEEEVARIQRLIAEQQFNYRDGAASTIDSLLATIEQLKQRAEKAEAINNRFVCAYCQLTFPKTEKGVECVAKHVSECEKNPMLQALQSAERSNAEMREALVSASDTIHLLGGRLDSKDHDGRTLGAIDKALSKPAGNSYIRKDQIMPIVEALEEAAAELAGFGYHNNNDLKYTKALTLARELGLGKATAEESSGVQSEGGL